MHSYFPCNSIQKVKEKVEDLEWKRAYGESKEIQQTYLSVDEK